MEGLDAPSGGRQAYYSLQEGQEYAIDIDIRNSFGRTNRIDVVNIKLFTKAIFQYEIN